MTDYLAEASPSKRFFIEMFTRDISLEDCILDLIDNSIDSLIMSRHIDVSDSLLSNNEENQTDDCLDLARINVSLTSKLIKISDNCGGISWDHALKDAFRFGHKSMRPDGQLGVYGIGLKRAILKIGNDNICIKSQTENDGFEATIDAKWLEEENNWKIPLHKKERAAKKEDAGTIIEIKSIRPEIKMMLESGAFIKRLKDDISKTYAFFINKYVSIFLNGVEIQAEEIPIGESTEVNAAVEQIEKEIDGHLIKVTIISSLAARDEKGQWSSEKAGWYVLCNGRVILSADKSTMTGWGAGSPSYHNKYMGFVGMAFFYSKTPHMLPWTTTKRSINAESRVFQEAKNKMIGAARPVLNFLNNMYPSEPLASADKRKIADSVTQSSTRDLLKKEATLFDVKPIIPPLPATIRIQYDALNSDVDTIKRCIKKQSWSARKVGEYTFKHFLKSECS